MTIHSTPARPYFPRLSAIAAIGEILWDLFPAGPQFGGAPANFACTAAALRPHEQTTLLLSAVGEDELGQQALQHLKQRAVPTTLIQKHHQPTGQVNITLDDAGVADYRFLNDCAWDHLQCTPAWKAAAEGLDAVCFGSLGQRNSVARRAIREVVNAMRPDAIKVFDINLRKPYDDLGIAGDSLNIANALKLNEDELPLLADHLQLAGNDHDLMRDLAKRFDLTTVALTRGPHGAALFHRGQISDVPGIATTVVDTVGAGDAFTAAMVVGLLAGDDLDKINQNACELAAFVCSQAGGTPEIPARFRAP